MPRLMRYAAPNVASPNAGLGSLYAAAGKAQGQRDRQDRNDRQYGQLMNFGLGLAGQWAGNQFANQRQRGSIQINDEHRQQLVEEQKANRERFLQDLYGSHPDLQDDPSWGPFHSAIASGTMEPGAAIKGFEAANQHKAAQEAKGKGLDIQQQRADQQGKYQQGSLDIRQQGLGLQGRKLDETVRHNTQGELLGGQRVGELVRHNQTGEGQGQQRIDETGRANLAREGQGQLRIDETGRSNLVNEGIRQQNADTANVAANRPRVGSQDREHQAAQEEFKRSMEMASQILDQVKFYQKQNAGRDANSPNIVDTSLLEQRAREWSDRAVEFGNKARMRLEGLSNQQAPAPSPQPSPQQIQQQAPDMRNVPQVPHDEQPMPVAGAQKPDKLTAIHTLLAQNPNATDDQIKQWLAANGY